MDQWHRPSAGYLTLCTSVSGTGVFVASAIRLSNVVKLVTSICHFYRITITHLD